MDKMSDDELRAFLGDTCACRALVPKPRCALFGACYKRRYDSPLFSSVSVSALPSLMARSVTKLSARLLIAN